MYIASNERDSTEVLWCNTLKNKIFVTYFFPLSTCVGITVNLVVP